MPRLPRLEGRAALAYIACLFIAITSLSCVPDPQAAAQTAWDLKPPALVEAGPVGARSFVLRFDEAVTPIEDSFALDPGGTARAATVDGDVRVELPETQVPGARYSIVGEVRDGGGNSSRFLLSFSGFNDHPARLRIGEVQTAKNSSASQPHRDFVELEVVGSGNLGGIEFGASSSVKTVTWRFPGVEVTKGQLVVLHCAPEGLAAERDEIGGDLLASGGIDSSPARDFWSKAGGIPDANGLLVLREGPGGKAFDCLFYADGTKTGALGDTGYGPLVEEMLDAGLWEAAGVPAWEDAFIWKPSVARSILRIAPGNGPGAAEWGLSDSGGQTPGSITVGL